MNLKKREITESAAQELHIKSLSISAKLGYEAVRAGRNFEIAGVAEPVLELFSKRRAAIEQHLTWRPSEAPDMPATVRDELAADALYAPYLDRLEKELERKTLAEDVSIPIDLSYGHVGGLSYEMIERLEAARPETLGAMARVQGVTPAAITAVLVALQRKAA